MAILKPLIQKLWASGGAIVQPSDIKIETGWTAEVPPHQWENWIQNRQDQYLAHINERGVPEWDSATNYIGGKSYVQGSNGHLYVAVVDNGPSGVVQNPTTDSSEVYWADLTKNNVAYITTTGASSWTVPAILKLGLKRATVEVYGAGGGGGYRTTSPSSSGGGQGGIAHKTIDLTGVTSVAVNVGVGGAGSAVDGVDGSAGGTTSFGAYVSATGGAGGFSGASALAAGGGNGVSGDLNIAGSFGGIGVGAPGGGFYGGAGGGGSSPVAAGGTPPTIPGHGGGGRSSGSGQNGANGLIVIRW